MPNLSRKMSLIEALTTPTQQILQQMKSAGTDPAPHWTEYLRETRDDDKS